MPNIETIFRDHVTLQVECIDRPYLHGYVPGLQRPELPPNAHRAPVALFFSKTYARILRPGLARLVPARPPDIGDPLASAWHRLDTAIDRHIQSASLAPSGHSGLSTVDYRLSTLRLRPGILALIFTNLWA